jgi:hypothetical protein
MNLFLREDYSAAHDLISEQFSWFICCLIASDAWINGSTCTVPRTAYSVQAHNIMLRIYFRYVYFLSLPAYYDLAQLLLHLQTSSFTHITRLQRPAWRDPFLSTGTVPTSLFPIRAFQRTLEHDLGSLVRLGFAPLPTPRFVSASRFHLWRVRL